MIRSYRYKLTPTRSQERELDTWLELLRELYNAALQERRDAWKKQRVRVTAFDQMKVVPEIRAARAEYNALSVAAMRGAIRTCDKAFAAFFRRVKAGEKPGYPRFKGRDRFDTISIDDLGGKNPVVAGGKRLAVPLLGKLRIRLHRPLGGVPKAIRITRTAAGWYVSIQCIDVPAKPLLKTGASVGVDVGLTTLAATSDGQLFENARPLKQATARLRKAQRRVSRRKKGSTHRREAVRCLARAHEHVANVRRERAITIARALVAKYDVICIEDVNVKGMCRGMFSKHIADAGWSTFTHWLDVKAEEAGREIVRVNPAGTSQVCSECGIEVRKDLSVRVHCCPHCGLVLDRDVNAARNILRAGRALRRDGSLGDSPMTREVSVASASSY